MASLLMTGMMACMGSIQSSENGRAAFVLGAVLWETTAQVSSKVRSLIRRVTLESITTRASDDLTARRLPGSGQTWLRIWAGLGKELRCKRETANGGSAPETDYIGFRRATVSIKSKARDRSPFTRVRMG